MSATEDTVSSLGAQSTPGTALEEERQVLLLLCSRGIFFLRFYLFLERGEGRETERERNIDVWLPLTCPQLGIWPTTQVWESNWQPFGSEAGAELQGSSCCHIPGPVFWGLQVHRSGVSILYEAFHLAGGGVALGSSYTSPGRQSLSHLYSAVHP